MIPVEVGLEAKANSARQVGERAHLPAPEAMKPMALPKLPDKLRRTVWLAVWFTIYRLVPTPLFPLRCAILRLFGGKIARGARPYPGARIWAPWNLEMRSTSCIANGVECYNVARVTLMENCTVSQRSFLCTAGHDLADQSFQLIAAPIVVGPNAWVGAEAYVGPGVTIAEGGVAGARAVVTRCIPPYVVVAGNPARQISKRTMSLLSEREG